MNNKPLRIGVDFHTFDGIYQGSRSHILGLYEEAIRLAPDFRFVFLLHDTAPLREKHPIFASPNVELVSLPHRGGLARLGWQLALAQRRERLDLLHLQYRLPLVPLGPCACTIHDVLFETHPQYFTPSFVRMSRWTSRLAIGQSKLLFTVSRFSAREMARLYGIDESHITVTPNGIDVERFHPGPEGAELVRALGLQPGGYICTIGRLEPRKNHLNLIRAYAKLPAPRPPLVVIGQRDFNSEPIFSAVRESGLENEVRFFEKVEDRQLPALLRHAAVFAYPTFAEGFGMPVTEAMASGVPVLTSNTTSLPEVSGGAALLVDPHSTPSITDALSRLLNDPVSRARAIENGLARAAIFNWRASAAALVDAYRNYFSMPSRFEPLSWGRK